MKRTFTISNILSFSRLLMLPFIIQAIKNESYKNGIIIILFLIFYSATDFLDGYLARKLNQSTKLGKILDPVADKITIIMVSYTISLYKSFPIWAFYVILSREAIVLLGSTILLRKKNLVPTSNLIGKGAVFFLSLSFLGYLLLNKNNLIPYTLLIVGLTLNIISFLLYFLRYLKIMEYVQKHISKLYSLFQ